MKKYEEVANNVFKRRDEYIAKKKKEKKIVKVTIASTFVTCIIFVIGCVLWSKGDFGKGFSVVTSSQNTSTSSEIQSDVQEQPAASSNDTYSSEPSNVEANSSREEYSDNSSYVDSYETDSSQDTPSVKPVKYYIDSWDKINFYSAKKIINENNPFPIGTKAIGFSTPRAKPLNIYVEYPIDREKVFTTTMVTYFTIKLYDEKGFLAQKLGGIGQVEVVITKNNIDELGQMITFKRGENYYSCLLEGESYDPELDKTVSRFSSYKFIDGFSVVKNKQQENYMFYITYDSARVVGFECAPFQSTPTKYSVDKVALIEENCVVMFTKQNFTIEQIELYYKNK